MKKDILPSQDFNEQIKILRLKFRKYENETDNKKFTIMKEVDNFRLSIAKILKLDSENLVF